MTRGIKLSDAEIEFIHQNHETMFNRQIAKKLGINPNTVKKYVDQNEIE